MVQPDTSTGITVITSTNRPHFMEIMFANYRRLLWTNKEWIIVVNHDHADMSRYRQMAARHHNVRVFRLPGSRSLGSCLNFACKRAKHSYITKMDDDEYYAPYYLHGLMHSFRVSGADVVGKRAIFIHLAGSRMLLLRTLGQNRYVSVLAGGTITFKKSVWQMVKFSQVSIGEDSNFCRDCRRKGYKLYSGDSYNFCALRRKQPGTHTWKATDRQLIRYPGTKIVARNSDRYKKYVVRNQNALLETPAPP